MTTPSYGFKIIPATASTHSIFSRASDSSLRYVFYMDPPDIRVMSFKGGGGRAVVYTKFLEIVQANGLLNNIQEVGGSSSGCIPAAFAAIHYEDSKKRTEALNEISAVDKYDIFGKTFAWKSYEVISAPLYFFSLPFIYAGRGLDWLAKRANQSTLGKLIGYPLKALSVLVGGFGKLVSPRGLAGLFNLITMGAIYRGDKLQDCFRDRFQQDTLAGVEAILARVGNEEREHMILHLISIGLCQRVGTELFVVPDITFSHLAELAKLPHSHFKEFYTTGLRLRDKTLVVFNKENTPDAPIHLAFRLAITFPLAFKKKRYLGDQYIDGGVVDNGPVSLATDVPVTALQREHGITDRMARLNVRVEYPDEFDTHLWHQPPGVSRAGKVMHAIKRWVAKKLTGGVDCFAADDEVTRTMQQDYAQRTLQLADYKVRQGEYVVGAKKMAVINAALPVAVQAYFDNHAGEKAVIENYQHPKYMSIAKQKMLLAMLQDNEIKTDAIFDLPEVAMDVLERLRLQEIEQIQKLIARDERLQGRAACLLRKAHAVTHFGQARNVGRVQKVTQAQVIPIGKGKEEVGAESSPGDRGASIMGRPRSHK